MGLRLKKKNLSANLVKNLFPSLTWAEKNKALYALKNCFSRKKIMLRQQFSAAPRTEKKTIAPP